MKGGSLTGNQLNGFFNSQYYSNDQSLVPQHFIPLDEANSDLFNHTFVCYFNPENIHLVIVHRGTDMGSLKDAGNNIRNMLFVKTEFLKTERSIIAEKGHIAVKKFLQELYVSEHQQKGIKYKNIIDYIHNLITTNNPSGVKISVEDAVTELLQNKLTTIGHSQGAVYCYLYGGEGKESIVFNPAPYIKMDKPANTYEIHVKHDLISLFSSANQHTIKQIEPDVKIGNPHSINNLKGKRYRIGNLFLYTNEDGNLSDGIEKTTGRININKKNNKTIKKNKKIRNKKNNKISKINKKNKKK